MYMSQLVKKGFMASVVNVEAFRAALLLIGITAFPLMSDRAFEMSEINVVLIVRAKFRTLFMLFRSKSEMLRYITGPFLGNTRL